MSGKLALGNVFHTTTALILLVAVWNTQAASQYVRRNNHPGVIVFVHGIFGDATHTWTHAETKTYWPTLLTRDPVFDAMDIYVYEYPTPTTGSTYSLNELADHMRLILSQHGVFNHQTVIFLSHSMGGLVTRSLILKYRELAPKVKFISFFAPPTTGVEVARIGKLFSSNPQLGQLIPMESDHFLANLLRDWVAAKFNIPSYCAYEIQRTYGVKIVEQQSASNLCNNLLGIDTNHIDIVKPANNDAISYLAFRDAFQEMGSVSQLKSASQPSPHPVKARQASPQPLWVSKLHEPSTPMKRMNRIFRSLSQNLLVKKPSYQGVDRNHPNFLGIATSPGTYGEIGKNLQGLIHESSLGKASKITLTPIETPGSVENLDLLADDPTAQLAIIQADVLASLLTAKQYPVSHVSRE